MTSSGADTRVSAGAALYVRGRLVGEVVCDARDEDGVARGLMFYAKREARRDLIARAIAGEYAYEEAWARGAWLGMLRAAGRNRAAVARDGCRYFSRLRARDLGRGGYYMDAVPLRFRHRSGLGGADNSCDRFNQESLTARDMAPDWQAPPIGGACLLGRINRSETEGKLIAPNP